MDNTAGSLSQTQKSVIIGSILGDGYLRIIKGRQNAFLEINHSLKQRAYVDWKYNLLKDIVKSPPRLRVSNNNRSAYRFYTRQHDELTLLFHYFYRQGIKIIPDKFRITPLTLAVWFMDDGSKCRSSDIYLNTQQFDDESQGNIIASLKDIGLTARLNKDAKYKRVRFIKSCLPQLVDLVEPYIIPSMRYKIEI